MRIGSGRSRIPAALLLVVAVLCLALAMHAAAMGDHVMSMLGACLAVLVAIVLTLWIPVASSLRLVGPDRPTIRWIAPGASPPRGRYPPDEGTVLRH
ncbi:MAG: hypothetical protein WEB06_10655 [Actinomycetota bacterium]